MASLMVDKRALLRDVQIREHPLWEHSRPLVQQLIVASRGPLDASALRKWHSDVIGNALAGEQEIARVRQQIRELRSAIKRERTSEGRRRGSELLDAMKYEVDAMLALLSVLRTLADAVVWRVLDYNRAAIAVLGEGQATRHFASGVGLDNELATIERLWTEEQIVALHADLTTCVRHGDLLCLEPTSPVTWRLEECKLGRGGGDRRRRQAERRTRLENLLNHGVRPPGEGQPELRIVDCPVPIRAHHQAVQQLLSTARQLGYSEAWLEEGVFAQVVDHRDPRAGVTFDEASRNERALVSRGGTEDSALRYSTLHRRIRDRRETFSSQAPLGLLPYSAEDVADLCMGRLDVLVTLDAMAVQRRFKRRGITAAVGVADEAGDLFVSCERGTSRVRIPAPVREQVMLEGVTLDTVVDIGDWMLDHPPPPGQRREVALRYDERALWRPLNERV